jgi:hypothetical protein
MKKSDDTAVIETEIVGKVATVASLPLVASLEVSAVDMAAQIRADMESYERMSRDAALIALRIGLRLIWIRDNEPHGSLLEFMRDHFADKGQRTLYRYIGLADSFLTDSGLRDRATFKLTGKALAAVAPICSVQLELFSDPQAALEGALKKVVKWVGERGLAQIYRELETKKNDAMPPRHGKGGRIAEGSITPEMRRKAALEQAELVSVFFGGRSWEHLEDGELAVLDNLLDQFGAGVREILSARRAAGDAKTIRNRKARVA